MATAEQLQVWETLPRQMVLKNTVCFGAPRVPGSDAGFVLEPGRGSGMLALYFPVGFK